MHKFINKIKTSQDKQKGQALILTLVIIVIIGSIMMVGGFKKVKYEPGRAAAGSIIQETPGAQQENLQLKTFKFKPVCTADDSVCHPIEAGACCPDTNVFCSRGKCTGLLPPVSANLPGPSPTATPCSFANTVGTYDVICQSGCGNDDGVLCYGKPVILLYPEKPTLVDVEVATSGEIFVSDPEYPAGGWKNILAQPDGSLTYSAKDYSELFYESKVKNYGMPATGLVLKTSELEQKLPELLYKLGLNENKSEIPEFVDFWLPKLKALNSPYVFVSVIDKDVKAKNDLVVIKPEPDTRIELIVYFKPLSKFVKVEPLNIGSRPVRRGFTMVEWGGTIDNN